MSILNENGALADELVRYSRLCYDRHLVGAAGGNLGTRVPGRDAFIVTATGVSLRDVARENLLAIDSQGKVLEGPAGAKPSKETGFHLAVFEVRPDASAIVHVHPTYATVFAVNGRLIPTITISAQLKLKQGKLIAIAPPGSKELRDLVAQSVKESSRDASIFLLASHGMLAISRTFSDAFDFAELAEDTAKIAYLRELRATPEHPLTSAFRIVDLTALLNERIQCYPTDPSFSKSWHTHFDEHGVYVSKLEMGAHSGTHVDAPLHFLGDGFPDVAEIPLQRVIGECTALERLKGPGEDLTVADLVGADILPGDIVLFRTGWDKRSGSPAFFEGEWPGLQPALVEELIRRGVKAVGGDIASADSPAGIAAGAPAHKLAGRAGLPIFEALVNLDQVTGKRFHFLGLPLKLEGGEASPIRAVALVPQP
ncbi:MAG TPA: class II aldolase/adducin family protein [Terriglobia bacterium]|nr:class II aldolase/adducin family protein [Terriglobia bacterium]